MNTVNADNFNETMDGYVRYALDFMQNVMLEKKMFSENQIDDIKRIFNNGLNWAKDEMAMRDARVYRSEF